MASAVRPPIALHRTLRRPHRGSRSAPASRRPTPSARRADRSGRPAVPWKPTRRPAASGPEPAPSGMSAARATLNSLQPEDESRRESRRAAVRARRAAGRRSNSMAGLPALIVVRGSAGEALNRRSRRRSTPTAAADTAQSVREHGVRRAARSRPSPVLTRAMPAIASGISQQACQLPARWWLFPGAPALPDSSFEPRDGET
jgi:hypothetical protein